MRIKYISETIATNTTFNIFLLFYTLRSLIDSLAKYITYLSTLKHEKLVVSPSEYIGQAGKGVIAVSEVNEEFEPWVVIGHSVVEGAVLGKRDVEAESAESADLEKFI